MQQAIFIWVQTKNGPLWVFFGSGGPTYVRKQLDNLYARRSNVETMTVDLPNPYAQPVQVSNV